MRKVDSKRPDYTARLPALRHVASELRHRVLLFLFGSYAQGKATPLSDLDLAYLPLENLSTSDPEKLDVELYTTISRTLGTDDFTLVNLLEAPPRLGFAILREGRLLWDPGNRAWSAPLERTLIFYPEAETLVREALEYFAQSPPGGTGTMDVDRGKVLDQLRRLETDLHRLKEKAEMAPAAFLEDPDSIDTVERRLQTGVECCVNVGNHLISRLGLPLAEDYASVFGRLGDAGLIPADLALSMAELARLRNLLVHLYWRVDHERIHRTLPERIAALEAFSQAIRRTLEEAAPG